MTAWEIWQWAKSEPLAPARMPARVTTEYSFAAGSRMLYRHFDGRMLDYPPKGYNEFGRAMWG